MQIRTASFLTTFLFLTESSFAWAVGIYPSKAEFHCAHEDTKSNLFTTFENDRQRIEANLPKILSYESRQELIHRGLQERNKHFLQVLSQCKSSSSKRKTFITRAEAEKLNMTLTSHPVVGFANMSKYDSKGQIGFCFGRAAFIHIELLRMGVSAESIAKVFAIGGFSLDGVEWDYHATTLVRGPDSQWWAIDGIGSEVQEIGDWMKKVESWSIDKVAPGVRFYLCDANKFQPQSGDYLHSELHRALFHHYFEDLERWLKLHPDPI